MISRDYANLMMAGRCVSSDRETNSALRVKASCMAMGQSAATATALAVREHADVSCISVQKVLKMLDAAGAIIPGKEKSFAEMFPG